MYVNDLDQASASSEPVLARRLGLATATALIIGEVIGVGIFLVPAGMAKSLGSPGWLLVVWLIMGASALGGALCYGALAVRYPEAGGSYVYLREAYGPRAAFLYGWISLLVTDPGLTAMLAVGLAGYVSYLFSLSPWELKSVAIAAIVVLAAVNMAGISVGSRILRGLAALKLSLLGFLLLWGFALGRGNWSNFTPFWTQRPGSDPLLAGLAVGLVSSFFSFAGWWDASKLAGEMRDPRHTLPRALILGVSCVMVVYVAITAVFLYLVPLDRVASDTAFAAVAGEALFGSPGGMVFAAIVIVSVTGSLAAMLMASPRVYYAMARDRLFFPAFAKLDPSRGTPIRAIAIQAILAVILAASGTFEQILAFLMVPTLAFLVLTVAAVFVLRHDGHAQEPLATPGFPLSPLLFLIPVVTIIILLVLRDPLRASIGLLIVLLGVPISGWVVARSRSRGESVQTRSAGDGNCPPSTAQDPSSVSTIGMNS
jgi:basic amino acid/polyamine antiporter, APA family